MNMNLRQKNKGFTLAELLVVIAVISLLSSIILVATTGVREKARIAAIRQFSASIKHAAGHAVVGEWKFENNLDNTFGEAGPGVCSSPSCTLIYDDGIVGKAISFNGAHSVLIPNSYALEPRNDLAITIEVWLKFNNLNNQLILYREPHYELYLWDGKIGFFLEGVGCSPMLTVQTSIEVEKWYHIVATYIPKDAMKIYLDGKEVASRDASGFVNCYRYDLDPSGSNPWGTVYTTPIEIGGCGLSCGGSIQSGLYALIEEIRIYNESYPPTIESIY